MSTRDRLAGALATVLSHYGDDPRMQPLRELAAEPVSGAPDPVGIPAGEQTGPVSGAPTFEPQSEPVAMLPMICQHSNRSDCALFGAHPPQRQPLPIEKIYLIYAEWRGTHGAVQVAEFVARAVERAHGIGGDA